MLRIAILTLGGLGAILLAVVAFGYALPVAHVAARDAVLPAPPERVFAAITEVERFPGWRSDVQAVDVTARSPHLQWRERGSDGTISFEVQESEPPRRLVTRIADKTLPFGGAWTFTLQPVDGGTKLTITENGEVYNPLFRVMSRFVFGHTATIDRYLEILPVICAEHRRAVGLFPGSDWHSLVAGGAPAPPAHGAPPPAALARRRSLKQQAAWISNQPK